MARITNRDRAEEELANALADLSRKSSPTKIPGPCPTEASLRRFAAGRYADAAARESLLSHLGSCERCTALLQKIRIQSTFVRRIAVSLSAAAILVFAIWLVVEHTPATQPIVTVDLRGMAPTRGPGTRETPAVQVNRAARSLRIIMPIGSEGPYECEIRWGTEGQVFARSSGHASIEDHAVVLTLETPLRNLAPGRYSLALRRSGSDWVEYLLNLK